MQNEVGTTRKRELLPMKFSEAPSWLKVINLKLVDVSREP